jgi:hypothetical protein
VGYSVKSMYSTRYIIAGADKNAENSGSEDVEMN